MTTNQAFDFVTSAFADREKIKQLAATGVQKAHQKLASYVDFIVATFQA
jgi:hypothetical protein